MTAASSRGALTTQSVTAAAVELADDVGLEAMTMRRLAQALEVTPMALYKHVDNREKLIDLMFDRLVIQMAPELAEHDPSCALSGTNDADSSADWRDVLREQILAARATMMSHPWSFEAIQTRPLASPVVLAYMDRLMGIMFRGGLSADLVHHAMHTLSTRMWGFTHDVLPTPSASEAAAESGGELVSEDAALASFAASFPHIVRMAMTAPGAAGQCDADAEFGFALDILIDAFEQRRLSGWSSTSSQS
ncbi:TetR/AcrR family transcriptional regulator C-terminal domain-containing protein [Microbacterium sp.]|uniref:TetR/AcrR family transcriptional regulator n=1 Tax=unclassified Microbacterium TaxID=2609290 RepID=UPI0026280A29|nr:TetR/AcrR family transcriptional regulator C-terminal domain-containing protein [Microbacterium sp.]